jgi:hypothetical protein
MVPGTRRTPPRPIPCVARWSRCSSGPRRRAIRCRSARRSRQPYAGSGFGRRKGRISRRAAPHSPDVTSRGTSRDTEPTAPRPTYDLTRRISAAMAGTTWWTSPMTAYAANRRGTRPLAGSRPSGGGDLPALPGAAALPGPPTTAALSDPPRESASERPDAQLPARSDRGPRRRDRRGPARRSQDADLAQDLDDPGAASGP